MREFLLSLALLASASAFSPCLNTSVARVTKIDLGAVSRRDVFRKLVGAAAPIGLAAIAANPTRAEADPAIANDGDARPEVTGGGLPTFSINAAFVAAGYGTLASALLTGDGAASGCGPCSALEIGGTGAFEECPIETVTITEASAFSQSAASIAETSFVMEGVESFVEGETEASEEKVVV